MKPARFIVAGTLFISLLFFHSVRTQTQSQLGQWGPVLDWGYQAKHMAALINGKVLVFRTGDTARVWDPTTGAFQMVPSFFGDLHCAIQLTLPDGKVAIFGGQAGSTHIGIKVTAIFDPATSTWTQGARMNYARWYPTATPLGNGQILVTNGDDEHGRAVKIPEVYDPVSNTWRQLTTASREQMLYAFVYQLPNGKVYEAAPQAQTWYLDTAGTGAWTTGPVSQWSTSAYSESGAMYAPGKILRVGGSDPAHGRTAVIDMNVATPQWRETSPMAFARRRMNLVILADGTLMAVGGTRSSDSESNAVLQGEIWNPATETWTTVASMSEARMYHSTALLLEDGRVVAAGGEASGRNHAQIYSPPYLFKGTRPVISSAPAAVSYGSTFFVGTTTPSAITSVALLRSGAPTHAIDMNQRYVPLSFTVSGDGLTVTAPPNGHHTPPGYYMLLLKNGNGVPSVAKWVKVAATASATGALNGRVTSATTGLGIAGAAVQYENGSTVTDPDGHYSLNGVSGGQHTVSASASGFASDTQTVFVSSGQTVTLDFVLAEPGSVTGQVVDTLGNAIPDATIDFTGGSTTTNSSGAYTIPSIASGTQTITAAATSYETSSLTVTVPPNGSAVANFTLAVLPSYIAGEVLDNLTNLPIPSATVSFYGGSVTVDSLGRYKLENVTPGTVSVTASAPGYVGATQEVVVPYANYATSDFALTPVTPPTPSSRIKDITFEGGLTDPATGFEKATMGSTNGTVLVTTAPLKETRSGGATTGYFEQTFSNADDFYVSFYLRVNALTASPRIMFIGNGSTAIGNLVLTSAGRLRLRVESTTVGSESSPLIPGQLYRVGVHQKRGTGSNGVLAAYLALGDSPFASPFAATSTGAWTAAANLIRLGSAGGAVDFTVDDVRLDRAAMPGPVTSPPPPPPVTADFAADATSGPAPLTVVFDSGLSTGNVTGWSWDVDNDGAPDSTDANPTVVYSAAGVYTVRLTVTNGVTSDTETKTGYITVTEPSPPPPSPPRIDAFAPTSGPIGTQVTLTGGHFTGVTAVTFNGTTATSVIVDSLTQIRATVPGGATTGPITVVASAGSAVSPAPFTVATGGSTTTLTPALLADAQVSLTNPSSNYGSLKTLRTRTGDTANPATFHSYLKFDVTGLSGTVVSAKLRLYATEHNAAGVTVHAAGSSSWTEGGITWNNAPAVGTAVGSSGNISRRTWVEIALNPGLFTTNQRYTVVLVGNSSTSGYVGSRESSTKPQLILTVAP